MKKIVTFVFAAVLSLAVLNVMATDKNGKKTKTNNQVKVVKQVNSLLQSKTPDGKVKQMKAITVADLQKIKQKAAQK